MKHAWLAALLLTGAAAATPPVDPVEAARLAIRTKDFAHAVELLRRLARDDNDEANYLLGLAAWSGTGMNADRAAARVALERAAGRNHARAQFALAALLAQGTTAERTAAGPWLERAAAAGYTPALRARASGELPLADPRHNPALELDLRLEIARFAARADQVDLLRAVQAGQLVQRRDAFGRTLLATAAEGAAHAAVHELLAAGAQAEVADDFGVTPLMLAARGPDEEVTTALLGAGARVTTRDRVGRDALIYAAGADQAGQVRRLLAAGAQLDGVDAQGGTATDAAQRNAAASSLAALREAGGHATVAAAVSGDKGIDAARGGVLYSGWPPLLVAAAHDDAGDIRQRVAAGAPVDVVNSGGSTALLVAVDAHAGNAVRALLELGADPQHRDAAGTNSLVRATRGGTDMLALLLERSAPARAEANDLLAIAVQRGDVATTRLLLTHGAVAGEADRDGMRPLARAARLGDADMLKLLIDRGAAASAVDARGRSALWYAAGSRELPAIEVLLTLNAPVNTADRDGVTPLVAAIRAGDERVVRRLIAAGASVEMDRGRDPPLRVAVELGNALIVDALLARQPDLNAVDAFGETALMAAARGGNESLCAKLLASGANPRLRSRDHATAGDIADARGFAALARRLRG